MPPAESRAARYEQAACSDVEAEEYDVAVADDVILALAADQSGLLRGVERALFHQRVEADDLGADEPALKVPAAPGAFVPSVMVHARTSFGPAVR